MEFNFIINPLSGRKVSIYGKTGSKVLKNYIRNFETKFYLNKYGGASKADIIEGKKFFAIRLRKCWDHFVDEQLK